ncbi:MAG: DNA polymerase III subunit alpha [Verrucomicrobia bacterium]|nr:DNA polymerase III subunit alpha [Verrucomicrobiota bacterium]
MSWVPLHVHSQYSILDASASVKEIAERAKEFGCPACALTDHGNLHGAVEFYLACLEQGLKPIIGSELYVAPTSRFEKKKLPGQPAAYHLPVLVKNQEGYRNLCKLSSAGFIEGFYYHPRVDKELLAAHSKGLICLSGCMRGRVAQKILSGEDPREELLWHRELFGDDYYIELQRHPMTQEQIEADGLLEESWLYQQYQSFIEKQKKLNETLLSLSKELSIPVIATNDSHYLDRHQWRAHEILLNIQSGEPCEIWEKDAQGIPKFRIPNPKRRTYESHELYFKSPQAMEELFADLPEAISNTLLIAEKINFQFDFKTLHYPLFTSPSGASSADYLRTLCLEGIPKRYTPARLEEVQKRYPHEDPLEVVHKRLEHELSVIIPKGMADYLLIVWDCLHWAKERQIPVGPGRGSGAGSIILYLIGVTDIEPLRFSLFFERFINPERPSYPDIDVDICMERRGEVMDYVVSRYGQANVAQIITFGTMKAKMAIKDVGRVLSVPLAKVNKIAKLVPEDLGMTLERALDVDPDLWKLYSEDPETKRLIDLAKELEGSIRNTGIHAAGVIIASSPLTDYIPICVAKESEMGVTQYSMKPVEKVGMLKMDFLGLKTLTSIQKAIAAIEGGFDPLALPLNDHKTFELLNQGKTLGVFQMESGGMRELARGLHIDRFEEIIAAVALYRPGPMDMIPSFIDRKAGREPIDYDHPEVKKILEETYGIMVYQEQVMNIAQTLAGYSLGEGDMLRRAMGKKIHEEMEQQRDKFRLGAMAHGLDEKLAIAIFDKMEKFASYGFNKSHAACYAFLTYVTAYLKANYPKQWMAALMTCEQTDIEKVARFIRECKAMEISILPPDVNESGVNFTATQEGIRFAMSAIKGIGQGTVEAIVAERGRQGPFRSLYDFCRRVDPRAIGKKGIESLVLAGAFDSLKWTRAQFLAAIETTYDIASKEAKEAACGFMTLFSMAAQFEQPPQDPAPLAERDKLFREKELLGFFLTGHPMESYRDILSRLSSTPFSAIPDLSQDQVFRTAFIVDEVTTRISQRTGKKFAILQISDGYESYELPVWAELYEAKSHLLIENQLLYAVLQVDHREGEVKLSCQWLDDLTMVNEAMIEACDRAFDQAKQRIPRRFEKKQQKEAPVQMTTPFTLKLDADRMRFSHFLELKRFIESSPGSQPLILEFISEGKKVGSVHADAKYSLDSKKTSALLEKCAHFRAHS